MSDNAVVIAQAQAAQFRELSDVATVPQTEYATVRDALWEVQRSAGRVLDDDLQQARQALADIAREYPVMQTFIGYQIAEGERLVRADLEKAQEELRSVVETRLGPHGYVPQRLETQRDEVLARADTLRELLPTATELEDPGEWYGEAAGGYAEGAAVQVAALEEYLTTTMRSAEYLGEAALLHRGTFFTCAATLGEASLRIAMLRMGDPGHLFRRTREAIALVRQAAGQVGRDVERIVNGQAAAALARGLDELLTRAEVLTEPTWPAGGGD